MVRFNTTFNRFAYIFCLYAYLHGSKKQNPMGLAEWAFHCYQTFVATPTLWLNLIFSNLIRNDVEKTTMLMMIIWHATWLRTFLTATHCSSVKSSTDSKEWEIGNAVHLDTPPPPSVNKWLIENLSIIFCNAPI